MSWPLRPCLKRQSGAQAEDANIIFLGIECRINQELNIRCDGEFLRDLQAVIDFHRVLIIQIGAEKAIVGSTPVINSWYLTPVPFLKPEH